MNTQRCDLADIHVFVKCLRGDIRDLVRISVLRVAKSRLYVAVSLAGYQRNITGHTLVMFLYKLKLFFFDWWNLVVQTAGLQKHPNAHRRGRKEKDASQSPIHSVAKCCLLSFSGTFTAIHKEKMSYCTLLMNTQKISGWCWWRSLSFKSHIYICKIQKLNFNDLTFHKIKNTEWTLIFCIGVPSPQSF